MSAGLEQGIPPNGVFAEVASAAVPLPGPDAIELSLLVDPVDATVLPRYRVTSAGVAGPLVELGTTVQLPLGWFDPGNTALAAGLISTSSGGTEFPATWEFLEVVKELPVLHRINAGGPLVPATARGHASWSTN